MLKFHAALNSFFEFLIIFKRHTKGKFLILPMRSKIINLISEKQLTIAENRKQADPELTSNEDLIFFDFRISLSKSILSLCSKLIFYIQTLISIFFAFSNIFSKMHMKMKEFVDNFTELWHSHN